MFNVLVYVHTEVRSQMTVSLWHRPPRHSVLPRTGHCAAGVPLAVALVRHSMVTLVSLLTTPL